MKTYSPLMPKPLLRPCYKSREIFYTHREKAIKIKGRGIVYTGSIKQRGRQALQGKWQTAVIVCFVYALIGMVSYLLSISGRRSGVLQYQVIIYTGYMLQTNIPANTAALIWFLVDLAIKIILLPSLSMGAINYFIHIQRGESPSWRMVFSQLPYWWRNIRLSLAQSLFVFLWSLLFIIPGIVAAISYTLAPYLLVDNPQMGVMESIGTSKGLMQGKKGFYFMLVLSFIGWQLLIAFGEVFMGTALIGVAALEIAGLFLQAYMMSTYAAFYVSIQDRA